jgi:hypothetical protein
MTQEDATRVAPAPLRVHYTIEKPEPVRTVVPFYIQTEPAGDVACAPEPRWNGDLTRALQALRVIQTLNVDAVAGEILMRNADMRQIFTSAVTAARELLTALEEALQRKREIDAEPPHRTTHQFGPRK